MKQHGVLIQDVADLFAHAVLHLADRVQAAWVVEAAKKLNLEWAYKVVAMGGIYIEPAISSFQAESIALENCTAVVKQLLEEGQTS